MQAWQKFPGSFFPIPRRICAGPLVRSPGDREGAVIGYGHYGKPSNDGPRTPDGGARPFCLDLEVMANQQEEFGELGPEPSADLRALGADVQEGGACACWHLKSESLGLALEAFGSSRVL